jgi:hypothetical protein
VIVNSITFGGAVVVDSMVVYPPNATPPNVVPPEELSAAVSSSPGSIFKPDFQADYGLPELSGTVKIDIPPTPVPTPASPPPPNPNLVHSSLSLGVSADGDGTNGSPFIVSGNNVTLDLKFRVLDVETNTLVPVNVTGVQSSDLVVSSAPLTRDTHFILEGIYPTDEVNSVSVELQAIGEWPDCAKPSYILGLSFDSDGATPVDDGPISGVAASNTMYISWSPGEEHLAQCLPTTLPSPTPTVTPTPEPTGALPTGARLSFNISFSDEDINTLESKDFQHNYTASLAEALAMFGGENVEVEGILEDNVVATVVIFPLQDGLEEKVGEVMQLLNSTADSEMDSDGTGLALLRHRMAQAGYSSPIDLVKESISLTMFVPPPPAPSPPTSPTIPANSTGKSVPPPAPTPSDDSTRTTTIIAASVSAGLVAVMALGATVMMYRWKQRRVGPENLSTNAGDLQNPLAEPMHLTNEG